MPKTAYDLLREASEGEEDLFDCNLTKLISDQFTDSEGNRLSFIGPENEIFQYVSTTLDGKIAFKRLKEGSTIGYSFKELKQLNIKQ